MKGFTLIELLIVVLIIGILSSIALPQYTRAAERARATEALQNGASIQRTVDTYCDEFPTLGSEIIGCPDKPGNKCGKLDADLENSLECTGDKCHSKNFSYDVYGSCEGMLIISIARRQNGTGDSEYELQWERSDEGTWTRSCYYNSSYGYTQNLCERLSAQGWGSQAGSGGAYGS